MARVPAGLPAGVRVTDHISLGVIAKTFPPDRVQQVLAETGKASERERDLPAQVMVYYAIQRGAGIRGVGALIPIPSEIRRRGRSLGVPTPYVDGPLLARCFAVL